MKYIAIILFLMLSQFGALFAASEAEDLMQKGNLHYQNGRYEQAIDLYQQVLKQGYSGKNLFYNLGNAYFKSGKIGYAILNYEKALKIDPNDEDIIYNLKIANARTVDKIEVMPKIFLVRWWDALLNMFSVNGWTIFTFVTYMLLLFTIGLYFLTGRSLIQKASLVTGAVAAFIFLFSILFLVLKLNNDSTRKYGVIVEPSATAKLSPDNHSGDAFIIHEGLKVDLEDNVADWVKVRLADGKVGWIPEGDLGNI